MKKVYFIAITIIVLLYGPVTAQKDNPNKGVQFVYIDKYNNIDTINVPIEKFKICHSIILPSDSLSSLQYQLIIDKLSGKQWFCSKEEIREQNELDFAMVNRSTCETYWRNFWYSDGTGKVLSCDSIKLLDLFTWKLSSNGKDIYVNHMDPNDTAKVESDTCNLIYINDSNFQITFVESDNESTYRETFYNIEK